MNRLTTYFKQLSLVIMGLATFTACEKDFINPGAASEAQVLSTADGVIGLSVGAQRRWSVGRQSPVYATITGSGFTTGELRLINPGNISENEVALGYNNLPGSNAILANIWEQSLLTRNETDKVIANASVIPDANLRAYTIAHASIFNALANGTMANFFEQTTLETTVEARFTPASEAVKAAIRVLESARTNLPATDGGFASRVPAGIDIPNTINALLARYYLNDGRYADAIAAANAVDLSKTSVLAYDGVATNPIAFVSILTDNVYQPIDLTLGLPQSLRPDPADQRLAFYFQDLNPDANNFRAAGFFNANTKAIPIYVPGEMLLIKAEAHARMDQLPQAIEALNAVLTKQAANDAFGIGAALPAYSGSGTREAILEAIYANRCIEMMMSGLRLGDSKRFNRPAPDAANPERNRNWYPYPFSERDNNPQTPADPNL